MRQSGSQGNTSKYSDFRLGWVACWSLQLEPDYWWFLLWHDTYDVLEQQLVVCGWSPQYHVRRSELKFSSRLALPSYSPHRGQERPPVSCFLDSSHSHLFIRGMAITSPRRFLIAGNKAPQGYEALPTISPSLPGHSREHPTDQRRFPCAGLASVAN